MSTRRLALAGLLAIVFMATRPERAHADDPPSDEVGVATKLDRDAAVRLALARNPALKAGAQRVSATRAMAHAEAKLPPPELSFDIWQVPFVRPVSFGDSQMISVGLRQTFPAIGALSGREEGTVELANAEDGMVGDTTRDLVREVDHALVDVEEATAKEENHLAHRDLAKQIEDVAVARQAAGASLSEATLARVDVATYDADAAAQAASGLRARAVLNGLLVRPAGAAVARGGLPSVPLTVKDGAEALLALARTTRPDLRSARARVAAQQAFSRAARSEALLPAFTLGIMYFAPTTLMPEHGYGLSLGMTLPWLWGGNAWRREAEETFAEAARFEVGSIDVRLSIDVATAFGAVKTAEAKLLVLSGRQLPAAREALDATLAAYRSGRGGLLDLLRAERQIVDVESAIIDARAALEHALVDLDWAVGTRVGRTPVAALGATP